MFLWTNFVLVILVEAGVDDALDDGSSDLITFPPNARSNDDLPACCYSPFVVRKSNKFNIELYI